MSEMSDMGFNEEHKEEEMVEEEPREEAPSPQQETAQADEGQGEEEEEQQQQEDKTMAILAYLSILVLIPLFNKKGGEFTKFHVKQGLALFMAEVAFAILAILVTCFSIVASLIPPLACVLNLGFFIISIIATIAFLGLSIYGIINVSQDKMEPLPIISNLVPYVENWVNW